MDEIAIKMTWLELVLAMIIPGLGAFLGSYLKRKGETRALHEDIQKLVDQVSATTEATKGIESRISSDIWRRERKAELQLQAINSIASLTSEFIERTMGDPHYTPAMEWYIAFKQAKAQLKALFDEEAYDRFKKLEEKVGPNLGKDARDRDYAVYEFVEMQEEVIKLLYSKVLLAR